MPEFSRFATVFKVTNMVDNIPVHSDVMVPLTFDLQLTPLGMDLVELSTYRSGDLRVYFEEGGDLVINFASDA